MYEWLVKLYYGFLEKKKKSYIEKLKERGLVLGENVNIVDTFFFDPSHCFLITIGDNCTFAPGVRLIAHDASTFTHLGYTKIGKIAINNNCFIGDSVIVLPCVTIGEGSIIGAGSVVKNDIPAGMVATGNPAKAICSVSDYIDITKRTGEGKKVFGHEYLIKNLTKEKREEILQSLGDSFGFIV